MHVGPADPLDLGQRARQEVEQLCPIRAQYVDDKIGWAEDRVDRRDLIEFSQRLHCRTERPALTLHGEPQVPVISGGVPVEDRCDADDVALDQVTDTSGNRLLRQAAQLHHRAAVRPPVVHQRVDDPEVGIVELRVTSRTKRDFTGELHPLRAIPRRTITRTCVIQIGSHLLKPASDPTMVVLREVDVPLRVESMGSRTCSDGCEHR